MRFISVRALRFGPLIDDELHFDHQLTIVHGVNEAAKSTWHAALLAGFCGMRRGRGKPRAEDAAFELRHAPWNGERWSVQLSCVTDAGQPLELTHDLRTRTATVVDTHTGEDLAGSIMFDGAPDGSALVGMDRRIFRSTAWVRQADVAAVRDDPAALQALMQTVADSSEASVGDALARIDAYRQTHVGSDRVGSTRPLRTANEAVSDAQRLVSEARESQTELHRLQANLGFCESRIGAAGLALEQLQKAGRAFEYEQARARFAELTRRSESFSEPPADTEDSEALYARVQEVLRTWAETAPTSEVPQQSNDDFRQLRELRDIAHERQQVALTMSTRFRLLSSNDRPRAAPPRHWFRRSLGLLALFAGVAGFVYPVAWALTAAAGAALLVILRDSKTPDAHDGPDRDQLRESLLRSGIDEASLSDGYLLFEEREGRFQVEQNAKIAVLERQLEDQRRSGVVVAQLQAQRFVASDALSAAVLAVGAAPLEAVDQEVAFLRRWSGVYETERGQAQQMRRNWQVLQLELQQTPLAELRIQVDSLRPDPLETVTARQVKRNEVDAAQRELRRYSESRAELSGRLEAFAQRQSVGDAEVSLAAARRRLETIQSLDFALTRTGEILKDAQLATYRNLAPRLQRRLGEMLASVTSGRYSRVAINPEDLSVRVEAEAGVWKDAAQLSHGTAETVYLLLRIVLAEELGTADESCPLLLDDTLVHLDSERKIAMLQLLQVLSGDRQVILFSQEEVVRVWAEQNLLTSQLVLLSTND